MSGIRAMLAALMAAAAVSACTTATPYQPYRPEAAGGVHGGYSDQQLAPDRYVVRFHGNELTSRDRVEGYMLYRAAELTLQRGFDWFLIVDRNTEHDTQTYAAPDPLYRPYYGPGYGYSASLLALLPARFWMGRLGYMAKRPVLGRPPRCADDRIVRSAG